MKKITLSILISIFFISSINLQAESKDFSAKINVFGPFVGQYQFALEKSISGKSSVQLSLGYISRMTKFGSSGEDYYQIGPQGFIIIPEYRYYFNEVQNEYYLSLFSRYRNVKQKVSDFYNDGVDWSYERTKTSMGFGFVVGFQQNIGNIAVFDIYIGPQYKSVSKTNLEFKNDGVTENDILTIIDQNGDKSGFGVRFGINIGIRF